MPAAGNAAAHRGDDVLRWDSSKFNGLFSRRAHMLGRMAAHAPRDTTVGLV